MCVFETQIATTFGCQMKRAVSTIVSNLYPESIWCLAFDNLHTKKTRDIKRASERGKENGEAAPKNLYYLHFAAIL